jgi:translation initiation factor IF-2
MNAAKSWNTIYEDGKPEATSANDGLLPHERAARSKLSVSKNAKTPSPFQPTQGRDNYQRLTEANNPFERFVGDQNPYSRRPPSDDKENRRQARNKAIQDRDPFSYGGFTGATSTVAEEGRVLQRQSDFRNGRSFRNREREGSLHRPARGEKSDLESLDFFLPPEEGRDRAVTRGLYGKPERQDSPFGGNRDQRQGSDGLGSLDFSFSPQDRSSQRRQNDLSHRPDPRHSLLGRNNDNWTQLKRKGGGRDTQKPARNEAAGQDEFWKQFQDRVADQPLKTRGTPIAWTGDEIAFDQRPKPIQRAGVSFVEPAPLAQDAFILPAGQLHEKERRGRKRFELDENQDDGRNPWRGARKSRGSRKSRDFEEQEWDELAERRADERRRRKDSRRASADESAEKPGPMPIFLPEYISVSNLAKALKFDQAQFLGVMNQLGFEDITGDNIMTGETAALVAAEFGFEPTVDTGGSRDLKPRPAPEDLSSLPSRPPIVTIMGHVDHGKTTLLDWLRKSSIAAQEHGGITQHIGAFVVRMSSGKSITFLDTPGHAAFLAMRQRGANCTDIVVLVVAADDSVMPPTLEALRHARAAKVPIIVAINKIDKEDARPDQVKADLARHGIEIEDFGGDVQVVCVSGKTGQGMSELEENISTLSEILDARAETDGLAEGWVLEASIKAVGKSATVLVKRGTLRPGDSIVAGTTWARVRALRNEAGVEVEEAPPGTPVEILGWRDQLPAAGDEVIQAPDEQRARTAVAYREEMSDREQTIKEIEEQQQRQREADAAAEAAAALEAGGEVEEPKEPAQPGIKLVNFIIKGDVVGSVEAVTAVVMEIGNNEVRPRILRASAGQISEFDVDHAVLSEGIIVNFNNTIPAHVKRMADDKCVKIIDHSVIYHLSDEVKEALSKHLEDTITSRVIGEAEVAQVFPINVKGRMYKNVAGCKIRNGLVSRNASVRVIRKGKKIFDGTFRFPLFSF